jgi:hypothetical protein
VRPTDEGVPKDEAAPNAALRSRFGAVNTITILENDLPAGF